MENQTPGSLGDKAVADIKKDFKLVGSSHVHSWYAWAIVGIVFGLAVGVIYVSNSSGQFEAIQAAGDGTLPAATIPSKIVISLSQPLPLGTEILSIKFDPTADKPQNNWVFDDRYMYTTTADNSLTITLDRRSPAYGTDFDSDNFFTADAPIGIEMISPVGDIFVSAPSRDGQISFASDATQIVFGNNRKQSAQYKISASFLSLTGKKTPAKFKADDIPGTWVWDYGAKIVNGVIVMNVPGPVPISGDMYLTMGPNPDIPGSNLNYWDKVFLPSNGSGNYEIVFTDSFGASDLDIEMPCASYAPPGGCFDVTAVIFTPAKGGNPISLTKPRAIPALNLGPSDILIKPSANLPPKTALFAVWASKSKPTKLWFVDGGYEDPVLTLAASEVVEYGASNYTSIEAASELGEPAYPAIIAVLPNGDMVMSSKVVKKVAKLDLKNILSSPLTKKVNYKFKVTYRDLQGNKIPLPDAEISLDSSFLENFNVFDDTAIPVSSNAAVNPGPLPLVAEVTANHPDDPTISLEGRAYIPAEPAGGVVEVIMYDSNAAFLAHPSADYTRGDISKVIFTPNGPGVPDEVNASDFSTSVTGQGSVIQVTSTPVATGDQKTKFGTRIADLVIQNIAGTVYPGTKVGYVVLKQVILTANTGTVLNPEIPMRLAIGTGTKTIFSKKTTTCAVVYSNDNICYAKFVFNQKILPGKSYRFGLVVDPSSLKAGTTIDTKIAGQTDLRYRYASPPKKKNGKTTRIDYILAPSQIPILLPQIKK